MFNEPNPDGSLFIENCNIKIPEKLPLVWDFKTHDPDYILGSVSVKKDDKGLILTGNITNKIFIDLLNKETIKNLGLGGYYNNVKYSKYSKTKFDERVVTNCNLVYVSITLGSVNPKRTFEIIDKEV